MKQAALLLTLALTLTACPKNDTAATTTPEETATETPETAATTPEAATPETTTPETAATPAVAKPGAVPAGYTLVPFLSDKPVREFKTEPALSLQDGKNYFALIDTNRGQLLADLYEAETPVTVNNFVFLARNHYFDGIRFHRVMDGFMAQSGDPQSTDLAKKAPVGHGRPRLQLCRRIPHRPHLRQCRNSGDGEQRSSHQRQPVFHYLRPHREPERQAHHLRQGGHG